MLLTLAVVSASVAAGSTALAGLVFQPAAALGMTRARGLNYVFVSVAVVATLFVVLVLALWGFVLIRELAPLVAEGGGAGD